MPLRAIAWLTDSFVAKVTKAELEREGFICDKDDFLLKSGFVRSLLQRTRGYEEERILPLWMPSYWISYNCNVFDSSTLAAEEH